MFFDEAFFEGEEREGFYIEPMMKRAWAAQLEVLQQIDDICKRNNIEYFADGGTLLGAIRHGGYIPWDDDLDIVMKRPDYERFFKIAEKELPQGYKLLHYAKYSGWRGVISRVVNSVEIPLKDERLQQFHGFPWVAGVDIFPIDYLPVDKSEEGMMLDLFRAVSMLAHTWDKDEISEEKEMSEEEKMKSLGEVETYCNIKFTQDKSYSQQLWTLADRISAMYWDTGAKAKEAAIIYILVDRPEVRIPVACYESTVRVPFENTTIPVPVSSEQILIAYYGEDYMTPKQGLADHEYPFYRKQQKVVLESVYKENGLDMHKNLWDLFFK